MFLQVFPNPFILFLAFLKCHKDILNIFRKMFLMSRNSILFVIVVSDVVGKVSTTFAALLICKRRPNTNYSESIMEWSEQKL